MLASADITSRAKAIPYVPYRHALQTQPREPTAYLAAWHPCACIKTHAQLAAFASGSDFAALRLCRPNVAAELRLASARASEASGKRFEPSNAVLTAR